MRQRQLPSQPARVTIISQDAERVVLSISVPGYELTAESHAGQTYQKLNLPEAGYTTRSGAPQLPVVNAILGVPADSQITVQVLETTSTPFTQRIHLLPAPVPQPITDEFSAGTFAYQPDPQAYASQQNYPEAIAEVADDGWLRDQRIARIAIYPFQYLAAEQKVTWHSELLVAVNFGDRDESASFTPVLDGSNPFEPLLKSSLLNYEQAAQWRATRSASPIQSTPSAAQDLATRYKIGVDQDGLYHLTYTDTLVVGIPTDSDPRNWQLTNLDTPVAIIITGQEDGSFDLGDELIFYGERFNGDRYAARYPDSDSIYWMLDNCDKTYCPPQIANYRRDIGLQMERYTATNVYWLEIGDEPGMRMAIQNGTPGGLTPTPYYIATVHAEKNYSWYTNAIIDAEVWYWENISVSGSATVPGYRDLPVTLSAIASAPVSATVRGAYMATTFSTIVNPDHHSQVYFNAPANIVEDVFWDDIGRRAFEANMPLAWLTEGANNLRFSVYPITGIDQTQYFDWYEVDYPRRFVPINNELWFNSTQAGPQAFQAGGYSSDQIWALDITQPLTPTQIVNPSIVPAGSDTYTVTLEVADGLDRNYFLAAQPAARAPKSFSAYTPPDLYAATNGADYIFITAQKFFTPTQELADYRASQGLRTLVVDINDVYNLFGGGIFNPEAIKTFLRYTYQNWQPPAPRFVLLAGYGHFNFHNYSRTVPPVMPEQTMPPYFTVSDAWQADVDSASLLAAVVGEDMLPDMLIGRVIVEEESQMQAIVDKIILFEAQGVGQDWQQRLIFLADNTPDPAGDFVAQSDEIISNHIPSSYTTQRLYLNNYIPPCTTSGDCSAIRKDYVNSLNNDGALFVNYMGHGSMLSWASPTIINTQQGYDHQNLFNNAPMLPIILDMTCLTGYYYYAIPAFRPVVAVEMVRRAGGGAIASFSPTSRGVSTGHDTLTRGFYDAVFQSEVRTLGEATLGGQMRLFESGYNLDLINTFVLFGDPALKLPLPTHQPNISTETPAKSGLPGQVIEYTLTIANTGSVKDTYTISAGGNWPITMSHATVGPLLPGESTEITAQVEIPITSPNGEANTSYVFAVSQSNIYKTDQQALTTVVHITPGIRISPPTALKTGLSGQIVTATLRIINTGDFTDTFTTELNHTWPITITPSTPLEPLAVRGSSELQVGISIPLTATPGTINISTVNVRSQNDPLVTKSAEVRITVLSEPIFPGVDISPSDARKVGIPGQAVTYTLILTNTGDQADTFIPEIISNWQTSLDPIQTLQPGQSQTLTVLIQVPITAAVSEVNQTLIFFRSQYDTDVYAATTLNTRAAGQVYMPLLLRLR